MPRPCKKRRIAALPGCCRFQPDKPNKPKNAVLLTLDEFEAIRLIDLLGLTQQECAERMAVARSTVQTIYDSARKKLAQFLIMGTELRIEGGDFILNEAKEETTMRAAVPYEQGEVFQHFGHTAQFKLYTLINGRIASSAVVATNGQGHGQLAAFLKANQVDLLICGGIGQGAKNALQEAGIALFPGVTGNADEAVQAYLNGTLSFDPSVRCNHHDHDHHEGGGCGTHSHECHCHSEEQ